MVWLPTRAGFCLCMVPLDIVSVHPVVCLPSSTFLCLRLHCALYAFVCAVCNVVLMVVFFCCCEIRLIACLLIRSVQWVRR